MANCCDNNTCDGLVTIGYLKTLADGHVTVNGNDNTVAPSYGELKGGAIVPKRSTDDSNPNNDVNGFIIPSSLDLIPTQCSVSADSLALRKEQVSMEWTTSSQSVVSSTDPTYCDLSYSITNRTTWTRKKRYCNGNNDVQEDYVGNPITKDTTEIHNIKRNMSTYATTTHRDWTVSFSGDKTLPSYKFGLDVVSPSSIPCDGGICTVTITGVTHCASELSVSLSSTDIEGYDGESWTNTAADTSLNRTMTINVPKNASDKKSGSFRVVATVWETSYTMDFSFARNRCSEPNTKLSYHLTNGTDGEIACDATSALTSSETQAFLSSLQTATVGKCVETIGKNAFSLAESLTSVTIGSSVNTIGEYALSGCTSLSSLELLDNVQSISYGLCHGCENLRDVSLPTNLDKISSAMFAFCLKLPNITIPQSVTEIGNDAFNCCFSLQTLTIPKNVTKIGKKFIAEDLGHMVLSALTMEPMVPPTLHADSFYHAPNCPIYVHCSVLNDYKTAEVWKNYADRIVPIEDDCDETKHYKYSYMVNGSTLSQNGSECDDTKTITAAEIDSVRVAIASLVVNDCVTKIGENAFTDSKQLKSMSLPDTLIEIGANAFSGCTNLTQVEMPSGVTEIKDFTFQGCISLHGFDIRNVTKIGSYAFADCTSLSTAATRNVTEFGDYAFANSTLTTAVLSDDLTVIPNMCFGNTDLSIITSELPNLTTIGAYGFYNCNITSFIMHENVSSVEEGAFKGCKRLSSVTVHPLTPPTLGTMAFDETYNSLKIYVHCSVLNDYKTAEVWKNYADRIVPIEDDCLKMEYDILNETKHIICNGNTTLTRGEIPTEDAITKIQGVTIGSCVETIGTSLLNMGSTDTSLQFIEMKDGVKTIGQYAFLGTDSLRSITWPNTLEEIQYEAFFSSGIDKVILPNGLKRLGGAVFQQCTSLTALTIPSTIEEIGSHLCSGCRALSSITIERQTPPILGENAFRETNNCPIYVPCEGIVAYKQADGWKEYCARIMPIEQDCTYDYECPSFKLSYITQGDDNPKIIACDDNTTLYSTDIGETALNNIYGVIIGECTKVIGGSCFFSATTLCTLYFQEGCVEIANNAFAYCSYLINFAFPNSLTTIGNAAFGTCRRLTEVTIPSGVTSIGNSAFHQCSSLRRIDVEATTPPILGDNAFGETNNCPIYVPCAAINAYKRADGWKEYSARIQTKYDECNKAEWLEGNGEEGAIPCDSSLTLSYEDFPHDERPMTHMTIGGCAETINEDTLHGLLTVKTLELKEGVKTIQTNAIAGCRNLKQITLPSSITTIGYNALYGCTSLEWIKIYATTPPTISGTAFSDTNNCPIYVPTTAVNAYKTALGSEYTDRIQPMP